uniref:Uncharacterized protein n=1 Tax=Vitis vinifera TaxID=29760 RepID=A5BAG9_VITVI|nr:hypothetical protein VITISV_023248 [Vitis vinifera]
MIPYDTWHRSFHPGISHPEFFSVDIPSGYLTSGILSGRRSTFSKYFAVGTYRRVRKKDDLTSPDRHVRILWVFDSMETKIKMGSPWQQVSRVMSLYSRKSQKKCILNSPLALAFRSERWGERAVTMAEGGGEKESSKLSYCLVVAFAPFVDHRWLLV